MSWLKERTIATKEHCNVPWSGNKENFRCGFCGHKFIEGDGFRMVYTNDMPKYGGNPLICDSCDHGDVREKWKKLIDEFNQDKFWRMRRWEQAKGSQMQL